MRSGVRVLEVALLTMFIVMAAMTMLVLALAALRQVASRGVARAGGAGRASTRTGEDAAAFDPALVAVLAAAAATALGAPVAVHRIHVHRGPERDRWSRAGRMDIMISHRVGPRR